ncbi:MAG: hypothetical protein JSV03_17360 [Planctomycetota bacterium]|nr:MAG: hypothetical protein JSV03_17360 [Planctomycetota bacterium]
MRVVICVLVMAICWPGAAVANEKKSERFGAHADTLGPVGGGKGYKGVVTKGDYKVGTIDELIEALKKAEPGQVVYVDDKAELDLSVRVRVEEFCLEIPGGVTLASGRGHNGSEGALICSTEFKTQPMIKVTGEKARITGLRLYGPDPKMRWTELPRLSKIGGKDSYYKFPTSDGIKCEHAFLEVDNCEIMGWGHGSIYLLEGGTKAHIHHNYIHHCQRRGLGYGVSLNKVEALIESNIFSHVRHAIAATGMPGTCYEARNNIVEGHANGHSFDMHGGGGKRDNGMLIAGDWVKIHHNTFKAKWKTNYMLPICIRGEPERGGEVHNNWFLQKRNDPWHTCRQEGGRNVKFYHNVFGEEKILKE